MSHPEKRPTPGATGAGRASKDDVHDRKDRFDSRGPRRKKPQKIPAPYYLNVFDGVQERRFAHRPKDVLVTRVDVVVDDFGKRTEEVRSASVYFTSLIPDGPPPDYTIVVPHGRGWSLYYVDDCEGFSVWRRPYIPAEVLP